MTEPDAMTVLNPRYFGSLEGVAIESQTLDFLCGIFKLMMVSARRATAHSINSSAGEGGVRQDELRAPFADARAQPFPIPTALQCFRSYILGPFLFCISPGSFMAKVLCSVHQAPRTTYSFRNLKSLREITRTRVMFKEALVLRTSFNLELMSVGQSGLSVTKVQQITRSANVK